MDIYYPLISKKSLEMFAKDGVSHEEIAFWARCSRVTVTKRMKRFGIKQDGHALKYKVDKNYFNVWSHKMAYILGFVMADGCLNIHTGRMSYRLKIEVNVKDVEVLEFIRGEISPTRRIQNSIRKGKNGKEFHVACLSITLKKPMFDRLCALGVVPRKTGLELIPEEIPEQYVWSFICGYFDGDGSVSRRLVYSTGHDFSICSASKKIIDQIKKKIPWGKIDVCRRGRYIPLWRIVVRNRIGIIKIREVMYANVPFSLKRKRDLMFEVALNDFQRKKYCCNSFDLFGPIYSDHVAKYRRKRTRTRHKTKHSENRRANLDCLAKGEECCQKLLWDNL